MLNMVVGLLMMFPLAAMANDFVCMGFQPEATMYCDDGGEHHKVHAFEEVRCAAGRDGVVNDTIPVENVEGPTWYDGEELAQVSFTTPQGDPVTLKNCTVLALQ